MKCPAISQTIRITLIFMLLLISRIHTISLEDIIISVEYDILKLRDTAEAAFTNRCNPSGQCSYHACSQNVPEKTCNVNFVTATCSCFTPTGTKLGMDQLSVKLADKYIPFVKSDDARVKEMVRTGQSLNSLFAQYVTRNSYYKWIYFGTSNGVFLKYPAKCTATYDNRYFNYLLHVVYTIFITYLLY